MKYFHNARRYTVYSILCCLLGLEEYFHIPLTTKTVIENEDTQKNTNIKKFCNKPHSKTNKKILESTIVITEKHMKGQGIYPEEFLSLLHKQCSSHWNIDEEAKTASQI